LIRLRSALIALLALGVCAGSPAWQRPQPASSPVRPADPPAPAVSAAIVTAPSIVKPQSDYPYPLGQTYVYAAVWRIFNAGTATLRMEQAGRENRVLGTASAVSAAALLYHVQDSYESFFDPATFCSHNTSRHIEEGLRRVEINITFDSMRGKSVLLQKNLKKKETKHEEHSITGCVTDVLSAIYYVASLPLQPGRTYSFPLNDGGETITVNVHCEAHEQIKTPAGTFNTIRVQPEAASGLLKDKGKIWVWYSDDAARVPVQARVHLYWGTLTFTLQRIDRK
jgi:Protein of unknown function (DUF3108)